MHLYTAKKFFFASDSLSELMRASVPVGIALVYYLCTRRLKITAYLHTPSELMREVVLMHLHTAKKIYGVFTHTIRAYA